jgi:DNA ligase-1
MKRFAALYTALDESTKTSVKLAALETYFREAAPADAAWAIYFLTGAKMKRLLKSTDLRRWSAEAAGVPDWLFDECYDAVGDLAETMALLLPPLEESDDRPLHVVVIELLELRGRDEQEQKAAVLANWQRLDTRQRFVWNKLITGAFRVGVSQRLVTRALAAASGIDAAVIAHRLMGHWQPSPEFYAQLMSADVQDTITSRPYPFFLAYPLESTPEKLGAIEDWQVEWKWDGIRAQLVRRAGETYLWSRGEELITERFPELAQMSVALPDGLVLDGEVLGWKDGAVLPFGKLQTRIGRKKLGPKILSDVPAVFMAYDLLEWQGQDLRERPLHERRVLLEQLVSELQNDRLLLSATVSARDWEHLGELREESRSRRVEGFMLKRRDAPYRVGRQKGDWWKWKIDPYTVDAVLLYAQRGSGKRASLYTDYTFAIWKDGELVPFAKAYSGLTDEEIRQVDAFVRRNTIERFGPVRAVKPELVFELGFEGIQRSTRHKSGIAVRFPRMLRWRTDKPAEQADTLETVHALLGE